MSSARIARGSSAAKPRPKGKTLSRGSSKKKPQPGMLDALPISADAIRRMSWWLFMGVLAALAIAVAAALQVPQLVGTSIGEAIGKAGFTLKSVEIKGAVHVPRVEVYNIAYDQPSTAMPLVDLEGTRERLLRFGWVKEARVSRRLPDTLVVDIVERTPAALWQHNRQLALIDREGVVLEQVALDKMPDLPLVIGPAANRHAGELNRLLDSAPDLKPMMAGATWVGGRRWDLRFQSGEVLALPEGHQAAEKALVRFARMDKSTQLLGRGLVRFDMRIPGRFTVRVSNEPGSVVPELPPPAPAAPANASGPVDPTTTI
jgi:cell division protein FtsQ